MDPNLVRGFFGNNFFLIIIMVRTLENNYFLVIFTVFNFRKFLAICWLEKLDEKTDTLYTEAVIRTNFSK